MPVWAYFFNELSSFQFEGTLNIRDINHLCVICVVYTFPSLSFFTLSVASFSITIFKFYAINTPIFSFIRSVSYLA